VGSLNGLPCVGTTNALNVNHFVGFPRGLSVWARDLHFGGLSFHLRTADSLFGEQTAQEA
jgi:hypothetical protein